MDGSLEKLKNNRNAISFLSARNKMREKNIVKNIVFALIYIFILSEAPEHDINLLICILCGILTIVYFGFILKNGIGLLQLLKS